MKYARDFNELTKIINKWDPIGLISGGAPEDEYSCVIEKILSILYKGGKSEGIKNYIFNDMNGHFGFGNEIQEEYIERYNKKIDQVSQEIIAWFNIRK